MALASSYPARRLDRWSSPTPYERRVKCDHQGNFSQAGRGWNILIKHNFFAAQNSDTFADYDELGGDSS